jgi:hypothetical protein
MASGTLKAELDALRGELARLRSAQTPPEAGGAGEAASSGGLAEHIAELNELVQHMLENAEDAIAEHPVATVAGALALGIVIGRLTAR